MVNIFTIGNYGSVMEAFQFCGSSSCILLDGKVGIAVSTYFNQSYAFTSWSLQVASSKYAINNSQMVQFPINLIKIPVP
jgi:hypothetical protein